VIFLSVGTASYFLPSIIGAKRKVVNIGSVFAVNALLGWTLIGWVVALAMAVRTNPPHANPSWMRTHPALQRPPLQHPQTTAGWFPDPSDKQQLRWWDGLRWTDHTSANNSVY
jgi:hypothetical protein